VIGTGKRLFGAGTIPAGLRLVGSAPLATSPGGAYGCVDGHDSCLAPTGSRAAAISLRSDVSAST
jgi:hypothetical protein